MCIVENIRGWTCTWKQIVWQRLSLVWHGMDKAVWFQFLLYKMTSISMQETYSLSASRIHCEILLTPFRTVKQFWRLIRNIVKFQRRTCDQYVTYLSTYPSCYVYLSPVVLPHCWFPIIVVLPRYFAVPNPMHLFT